MLKGPAHSKNENLYFLAPAQRNRMPPSLVSCEHRLGAICKKPLALTGPVAHFMPCAGTINCALKQGQKTWRRRCDGTNRSRKGKRKGVKTDVGFREAAASKIQISDFLDAI